MSQLKTVTCPGCSVALPYKPESIHYQTVGIARYGVASAECSEKFSEVLNYERELYGYPPAHRLIVDSYAVQHPPHAEIQAQRNIEERLIRASIQSISIHLLALYCALIKKIELKSIAKVMEKTLTNMANEKVEFKELTPPADLGKIKVDHIENQIIVCAGNLEEYTKVAYAWAESSWDVWKDHHQNIKIVYDKYSRQL
jgi:hypothetical protein